MEIDGRDRDIEHGIEDDIDRDIDVRPLGEGALRVAIPEGVDVAGVMAELRELPGVVDVAAAERHVAVCFDPEREPPDVRAVVARYRGARGSAIAREIDIAVRYDGADLEEVAHRAGMTVGDVIARHAGRVYTVRFVGFLPGFAYLADVDPSLVLPRRASPRPRVPAGAVAIAGRYTGVYPFASAGGWHLIGHAVDFVAFDAQRGAALRAGDRVRFVPLD